MDYGLSWIVLISGLNTDALQGNVQLDSVQPWRPGASTIKEAPSKLSEAEIQHRLEALPDWSRDEDTLIYTRTFEDFVEALAFVNALAAPAEELGHHPDITISYNHVTLELTTHDIGGLSELDFQLAEKISQL